ncbi:MAG: hypothetical protein IIV13_01680 [Bacteroidaceae bacterium]|nr:hypothetical protein [Bacteroidaceae bacterium]
MEIEGQLNANAGFADLLNEASFEYVGTREAQAEARKAEKGRLNVLATQKPGEESPEEDDDQGGTNIE